jgi:hypothetical protein
MAFNIIYWDAEAGEQRTRQSTPEEDAQREADIAAAAQPVLPDAIPMLNLHLVLIEDGHLDTVEQILAAGTGTEGARARAYWAKALTARRDNELVASLWPALYGTEEAFNDAWRRAAALNP